MKKICTFTGAAMGEDTIYAESALKLGQMIASRQLGLVYGGGKKRVLEFLDWIVGFFGIRRCVGKRLFFGCPMCWFLGV